MLELIVLSLASAANPTLLAAVTVMLTLPNPKRLLIGYLCGGLLTSVTVGLVAVFALNDSQFDTTQSLVSPAMDIAVGIIALVVAFVLATGRDRALEERRRKRRESKIEKVPWSQKALGSGSASIAFAVGVVLSFPGLRYLVALNIIADLNEGTTVAVVLVLIFNVIMFALAEIPLIGYFVAPERTKAEVTRFREWISRHARTIAIWIAALIGVYLIGEGVVALVS